MTDLLTHAAFVSLCTLPARSRSNALTADAENLPLGLSSIASAAMNAFPPLSTMRMSGLNVNETMHRFDVNAHVPTLETGVTSANRIGDGLGTISMRWLLAPDDFDPTPSATPPATFLDTSRSQRFVVRDGTLAFADRGESALRFFGAGRTYPALVGNRARVFFAGTAIVLDGSGTLKGTRGTLVMTGEISASGGVRFSVLGHFDADGSLSIEDSISPLIDEADADSDAVVLTLAGTAVDDEPEQLAVLRIGNDLANTTRVRSLTQFGSPVGRAPGRMPFHGTEHRYVVPLAAVERELAFTDPAGQRIGSITVAAVEGTSVREERDGGTIDRTIGYGCITGGTGALAGAAGVVTIDAALPQFGGAVTIYTVRLGDPDGRFHASEGDVNRQAPPAASGTPPPPPADTLTFVDSFAAEVTDIDRAILRYAERTLANGMELMPWWEAKDRVGDYAERFEVVRDYNPSDRSFGFFDSAVVAGTPLPVMGIVQEMFYDRQKIATGETIRAQLKEFVLRYFMRVSHFRQPEAIPAGQRASTSFFQRAISWLPEEEERRIGFGYQQLYYKLRESGKIGKFATDQQNAIVDLREIGGIYDWIVLRVDIFDFNLQFAPFGGNALKFQLPLKESTYLLVGPPFIKNCEDPEPGVLGQYGFGYAFLPYAPEPGLIAYGPGHFAAGLQTVDFKVLKDGEIRARAAFLVNRPTKIAAIDLAPIDWSFQIADMLTFNLASRMMAPMKALAQLLPLRVNGVDPISVYIWMANTMTSGRAGRQFGISKEVLEKRMLVQHFMQHYEMLVNSLLVWRTVPDWTDVDSLPDYCRRGINL